MINAAPLLGPELMTSTSAAALTHAQQAIIGAWCICEVCRA